MSTVTLSRKTYASAIRDVLLRVRETAERLREGEFPLLTHGGDEWWVVESDWETRGREWTSGFWVGMLWMAYKYTGEEDFRRWAERWNAFLLGNEKNGTNDAGFLYYYSSAYAYELTKEKTWYDSAIAAADRLVALYNPSTELIATLEVKGDDGAIDTMMNLQILWWAYAKTTEPIYLDVALSHTLKTRKWLVRKDGSSHHCVKYDPITGKKKIRFTAQGLADSSTWSRGQSWGFTGFTLAYGATQDRRLLNTARRMGEYIIANLPDDGVPWYDYDDPGQHYSNRDTSAAAIAAMGFFKLADLEPDRDKAAQFRVEAERMLQSLIDRYLTPVGSGDTLPPGILKHGCYTKPHDGEFIVGSYYLLEALLYTSGHRAPAGTTV